jgi:hypothetical protein
MLLVVVGGFAVYRGLAADDAPSRDFIDLELAGPETRHGGTCYALSTVLIANGVSGNTTRTWTAPEQDNEDKWMLTLENVIQGYNGPEHRFQKFTFERGGEQVRLISVEASEGLPTGIEASIDRLLEAPHALKSTPVDRCQGASGAGYQYPPAK